VIGDQGRREKRIIIDDLASYEEEIGVARGMKKRGRFSEFFRNLLVGFLLIGIVVGSFWISFLIGKRVLVPVKTISTRELTPIEEEIPEIEKKIVGGPAIASSEVGIIGVIEEEAPAKIIEPQPVQPETMKYYKVQAGLFTTVSEAEELSARLKQSGFSCFIKKLSNSTYRVQAGAFRTKSRAQTLVNQLQVKGFGSEIIYE